MTFPPADLARALEAAFREHQRGALAAAERGYRSVLAALPDQPDANHLLGVLLDQTGRGAAGVELIRRALEVAPGNADAHCNLGRVLAGLGRLEEAVASYESALALRPEFAQARFNLAVALRRLGRIDAAIDSYRRLLARAPGHAAAWFNLGNALKAAGRLDEAADCWRRALAADPTLTAAGVNLANAARARGEPEAAAAALLDILEREPDHAEACMSLAVLMRGRAFADDAPVARARAAVVACLARDDLEPQDLAVAGTALLLAGAPAAVTGGWHGESPSARRAAAAAPPLRTFLADPLLQALLRRTIVMEPALEAFFAGLRSAMLDAAGAADAAAVLETEAHWLVPLAHQCFWAEYVYPETEAESGAVAALAEALSASLAAGDPVDARVALLACYRPLHELAGAEALGRRPGPGWWAGLAQAQIAGPLVERGLAAEMPRLAGAERAVSEAVRRQYEENPYPRWHGLYRRPPSPFLEHLRRHVAAPLPAEPSFAGGAPRVLIAGCGTGLHALSSALQYEGSRVLAVDLSGASLAYARRRAEELGVGNVEFLQADLLDLDRLDRHFDVVESVGVLHHLAEPAAGWRVLRGLLAPGGYMKIGLYSELARRSVVAARALIAARGDPPTLAGIRAARAAILALPADAPARGVVGSGDFYSASGVRDLLFHVQEHRFTLPEVAALLDGLELEFLGFVLDDEILRDYRETEPGDPAGVSLTGWARYEAARPGTFGEMYQLWLRDAAG